MNVTRDRILEISNKEFERVDTCSRDLELHKTNDISLFEKTAVSIMVEIDDALNMLSRNLLEIKHTIKDKIRLDLTNIFNNNKDKLTDLKHFSSDSFEENLPIYVEHKIEKIKESIVDISSLIDDTVVKQEVFSSDLLFEKLNEMNHEPTEIVSSPFLNLEVNKNVYNQINVELQNFENWKQELNFANNIIKNIVILDKELAHLLEIDEGKLAVLPEDMKLERNSILHSTGILAELRYNIDQQKEISNQKLSKYIEKDIEKKQEKFSTFTDRNKEISDSISTYNYFKHKENELNQIELATKIKTKELKDKKKIILKLLKLEEKINLKEFLDDVRSYSIKWYKPSFENKLLVLSASTYFSSDIRFKLLSILGFKHIKENGETYHNALNYFKSADAIYENYELTIDPVAKFGLYLCSNPGSSVSIQYLIDIKAHYKKFKPEDKEFAIMALNTLFEYEAKTSPKQSVTTSLLIKNYSKGTVFFPQYSMNLSKLYLNLGRIEEGLKVLEELKDLKLTKKDQFHFHKLKSALRDLEGDFKNTLVELKIALKIGAKEDKNKILNRILKLYLKYEKWKEITEFSTLYEEHKEDINKFKSTINEAIKLAKTELERKKAKNIKLTIAEVETKLKMINTFLKTERQDLVPAFAHNIQEILFYLPDTEKYLHYLGLTFYYEAISYEHLLEELERLEGCYKLAEYCFNQTGDYHCLVETKLRRYV
ncbi:MAG: hypothetical protein ACTSPO_14030 [Candidatus Heimdallarchaeaceae archaeon]